MLKVIGLGNELRGDDAIGPAIIRELAESNLPVALDLINAGADAFTLLEHLIGDSPVLIIDCARMGKRPGVVLKYNIKDARFKTIENSVSLHGFGFNEVLAMAVKMGKVADCTVIGVEPKTVEFGKELSDEVQASIPSIVQMVIEEAKSYGG